MDAQHILHLWDSQVRFDDSPPAMPRDFWKTEPSFVRIEETSRSTVIGPPETDVRDPGEIPRLIARYQREAMQRGLDIEWRTWSHDLTRDLPEQLIAADFKPEHTETLLVGIAEEVATMRVSLLPDGLATRSPTQRPEIEHIAEVLSVELAYMGNVDLGALADLVAQGRNELLVVEEGDEFVATSWVVWKRASAFAGLAGAWTEHRWRHRGIQSFLIVERAKRARDDGSEYLYAEASSPESERNLKRLGFEVASQTTRYSWNPPSGRPV